MPSCRKARSGVGIASNLKGREGYYEGGFRRRVTTGLSAGKWFYRFSKARWNEEEAKVVRPMITLPDMQQAVLRMKHIDGLETAEIAHITGCTEEAVRQNLSRARKE